MPDCEYVGVGGRYGRSGDLRHRRHGRRGCVATQAHRRSLRKYGQRVQLSVFECRLSPERLARLISEIQDVIDSHRDSVIVYRFPGRLEDVRASFFPLAPVSPTSIDPRRANCLKTCHHQDPRLLEWPFASVLPFRRISSVAGVNAPAFVGLVVRRCTQWAAGKS